MQQGECSIMLGTRSALFAPLKNPGLIILDEEHDASLSNRKLSFFCRDIAVVRGKLLHIPVLLGSATPSLENLHNVDKQRYSCYICRIGLETQQNQSAVTGYQK